MIRSIQRESKDRLPYDGSGGASCDGEEAVTTGRRNFKMKSATRLKSVKESV